MIVENTQFRISLRMPIGFMALLAFAAVATAPAIAQAQKTVEIEVPADPAKPPIANPPVVVLAPGEELELIKKGGGNIFVVFTNEGKTPFVDRDGRPVYTIPVVHLGRKYKIREDENPCAQTRPQQSDCKYMVVDLRDEHRPPLDPYIIIR
ncbi:MAG: hypothetical protein ACNA7E_04745 [Wenzhouxiangellaceae bacterium]